MTETPSFQDLLEPEISRWGQELLNRWHQRHLTIPRLLYHYTTAEGLVGILNTQSFWMTNIRYMNDFSELQYATTLALNVIATKRKQCAGKPMLAEFFRRTENSVSPFRKGNEVFAASLCEEGNLLSQWRAYGNRGGGYAIGIDFFHLLRFLPRRCALRKVIYDPDDQQKILGQAIDSLCGFVEKMTEGLDIKEADARNILPKCCSILPRILGEHLVCFKHPEFAEEKEWRLIATIDCDLVLNRNEDSNLLKFRTFRGNIVPYVEVSLQTRRQLPKTISVASDSLFRSW
jgi:hypothetical protein